VSKDYLGDAVYADWDEYGALILTTEDGISVQNRIYLEPEVLDALARFIQRNGGDAPMN
jgi:Holliday junction resolvase